MRSLVDFINHGALPFIGREEETGALLGFWQETLEAQGLRLALLQGEAGIGKSRLVEEMIPQIVQAGGVVVRTKFYPESTTSIAPLLARATWLSRGGRKLLSSEPEGTLASVVLALQRIARLRPTLVVIEDLHLLGEEQVDDRSVPARELAALLSSLAGETISFLCVARPLSPGVRGLIEPWLVREIPLRGLDRTDYTMLWQQIFGGPPGQQELLPLQEATLGNPLAIRSALRGAINAGAIVEGSAERGWRLSVSAEAFARRLAQSVGILSEGMAVHLTPAERDGACAIAALGEVIARESAQQILGEESALLDGLVFKGILTVSESATAPLGEPVSEFPLLAFTHTLVHRHFVAQTTLGSDQLLSILASGETPLYSRLPFQLLHTLPPSSGVESEIARGAVIRCFSVAYALDRSSDWKMAHDVYSTGVWLIERYHDSWTDEQRYELEAHRLAHQLGLLWRSPLSDEYRECVGQLLEHTEGDIARPMLRYRLLALLYRHRITWRADPELAAQIHTEIMELVAAAPELLLTWTYVDHLRDVTHTAWALGNRKELRRMESQLDTLLEIDGITPEFRRYARNGVLRYLINVFDTPEELERRRALLDDFQADGIGSDPIVTIQSLTFFESIGEAEQELQIVRRALPVFREQGLQIEIAYTRLAEIVAGVLLGDDIDQAVEEAIEHGRSVPDTLASKLRNGIRDRLLTPVLLRADDLNARRLVEEFVDEPAKLSPAVRLLLGIEVKQDEVISGSPRPLFRLADVLEQTAALCQDGDAHPVGPLLSWLEGRKLFPLMSGLLQRHGSLLPPRKLARWRKRIEEHIRQRRAEQSAATEERMRLSMLGVIEIRKPGVEPARPRGARLRTVLGAMVSEQLLPEPLEYREFCRIAAGEDDLESARKILNVTIFRLREALGAEAIITGGETPRLNLELLDIDLVEAYTRVRAALEGARNGALVRALPLLREAIEILHGEVPFPGLYDSFFEAMREDLELELRGAIVEVAGGLMHEGDAGSAEELLRYATTAMAGDSELIEMLRSALISLGRRADAERVAMRDLEF